MRLTNLDYIELKKRLEHKGLLNYTPIYYSIIFFAYLVSFVLLLLLVIYFNKWYITALLAFFLGVVCVQFSFLGHEAGHRAISKNKIVNDVIGQIGFSLITGASFSSWNESHNKHHSAPNHEDIDPDVKDGSPFSFTEKNAKQRTGIVRFMTRNQTFLLIPALFTFVFIKRYVYSKPAFKNKNYLDLIFLAMHYVLFFGVMIYFIGFWQALLLYVIVSMLMGFFFGFAFLPNHLGMPILKGNENFSYLERQVLTSRDIKGNSILNFITGRLNYQIEHHIFPTISRKHMQKTKMIIKDFCQEKGIPYKDDSLLTAWREVFHYISNVSKQVDSDLFVVKAVNDMI